MFAFISDPTHDLVAQLTVYEAGRFSELQASFADPRGRIPAMIGRFVLTFRVEPEGSRTRVTRGVEARGAALVYGRIRAILENRQLTQLTFLAL